jgi:hypothetical protein
MLKKVVQENLLVLGTIYLLLSAVNVNLLQFLARKGTLIAPSSTTDAASTMAKKNVLNSMTTASTAA